MKLRRVLIYLVCCIGIVLLFIFSEQNITQYLSVSKPVDANLLVVEGWSSLNTIRAAADEFNKGNYRNIVTTGLEIHDYFLVPMNGFFVFNTCNKLKTFEEYGEHQIMVDIHSELDGEHRSHFNMYINDSLVSEFYVGRKKSVLGVNWKGNLSSIDSVSIQFDDDALGDFGDHNLYIKELVINDTLKISYKGNSKYIRTPAGWEKTFYINYTTYGGLARNRLIDLGIDPSRIIVVPCEKIVLNRTLSSALAFRNWLIEYENSVTNINILTEGIHARRTWMAYNKLINRNQYSIGIISIKNTSFKEKSFFTEKFNLIEEFFGIIYYWVLLHFY